jgi:hypothetical protein
LAAFNWMLFDHSRDERARFSVSDWPTKLGFMEGSARSSSGKFCDLRSELAASWGAIPPDVAFAAGRRLDDDRETIAPA